MCKKKVAQKTCKSYPEVTVKFISLDDVPPSESVNFAFSILECFTALMHKRTTNAMTVDEAQREIFAKDGRDVEPIPPTSAALFKDTFGADYIAGHA